eukprot:COSAG03_NODE_17395_length_376_cov_1.126354_2_plen_50_part_01
MRHSYDNDAFYVPYSNVYSYRSSRDITCINDVYVRRRHMQVETKLSLSLS